MVVLAEEIYEFALAGVLECGVVEGTDGGDI